MLVFQKILVFTANMHNLKFNYLFNAYAIIIYTLILLFILLGYIYTFMGGGGGSVSLQF